jgi:hypothetical protein
LPEPLRPVASTLLIWAGLTPQFTWVANCQKTAGPPFGRKPALIEQLARRWRWQSK